MRWVEPENKTTRVKKGFLWFPRSIKGETRWLEKAKWEEVYTILRHTKGWFSVRWIDS